MIYVTYIKNNKKRKGIISLEMFETYKNDIEITELTVHPTEQLMNECFKGFKQANLLKG